jgi:thymidine phosphorylase
LSADQVRWFIAEYSTGGSVADEEAAAMAIAIVWRGMTSSELDVWTNVMLESGDGIDVSGVLGRSAHGGPGTCP